MFINVTNASVHCPMLVILDDDLSIAHISPFTKIIALSFRSRIWVSNKYPRSRYCPLIIISLLDGETCIPNVSCTLEFIKTKLALPGVSIVSESTPRFVNELPCSGVCIGLGESDGSCFLLCSPLRYFVYFQHGLPANCDWIIQISNIISLLWLD